jgi:hypothetical protein
LPSADNTPNDGLPLRVNEMKRTSDYRAGT